MTVKTYIASGAYDPTVKPRVALPAEETQGHVKCLVSTIELVNGDSIASTVKFGSIPSNSRLVVGWLDNDAITGLTSFDLGGGKTVGGAFTMQDVNNLMSAVDIHLAGSQNALGAVDIANLRKPLWQILGYADDPGSDIDIVGTLNAAAGAAGTLTLVLFYATVN